MRKSCVEYESSVAAEELAKAYGSRRVFRKAHIYLMEQTLKKGGYFQW